MVLLKSLECCHCKKRCYPYFFDWSSRFYEVPGICTYCNNEMCCGQCVRKLKHCVKKGRRFQWCEGYRIEYTRILAYFDKFAPADEMILLSLRRWSPLFCGTCSTPKRVATKGNIFCPKCVPSNYKPEKDCNELTNFAHTKILLELNELLLPDDRKAIPYNLKTRIQLQCQVCGVCRNTVGIDYVANDGRLRCDKCCIYNNFYSLWGLESIFYFKTFLHHIPDMDDLKVLSYSKWTNLKCEKCSVVFSEIEERMPILDKQLHVIICQKCTEEEIPSEGAANYIKFHFLVDIIKEFRHYFKNHGNDYENSTGVTKATQTTPYQECLLEGSSPTSINTTLWSNLRQVSDGRMKDPGPASAVPNSYTDDKLLQNTSIAARKTIPDTLRCQCGRYEELIEMKNCTTCNKSALCPKCTIKGHWGHKITDTMPELIVEVVNNESDKIKSKLRKWRGWLEMTQNKPEFRRTNVTLSQTKSTYVDNSGLSDYIAFFTQVTFEGKETFANLVSTYETMFLKALESKNPEEFNQLMQLLDNFSDIEDLLMDSMTDIFEKLVKIDDVCAKTEEMHPLKEL